MIQSEKRYYLTTLKSIPEEISVPPVNEYHYYHLDKDYKQCDRFYSITIDRKPDIVTFILTREWDWERKEISDDVFVMSVTDTGSESQYSFSFLGNEISISDLQEEFIIADSFQPLDLFSEYSDENLLSQFRWFLALCGTCPYIYDYVEDMRG